MRRRHLVYVGLGVCGIAGMVTTTVAVDLFVGCRTNSGPASAFVNASSLAVPDGKQKAVDAGFVSDAIRFRDMAGRDLASAAAEFKASAALKRLIESPVSEDKVAWPLFFQGSIVFLGRLQSRTPVMACYHPLYDAALLTQWEKADGRWAISKAVVRSGCDLQGRGAPGVAKVARWTGGKAPLATALQSQCADFQAQFEKLHPPLSSEPCDLAPAPGDQQALMEFEVQLSLGVSAFRVLNEGEGMPAARFINDFRAALRSRSEKAIESLLPRTNLTTAAMLCRMDPEISANLRQHYAVCTPEKVLVFLIPSNRPTYLGIYEFAILPGNQDPPIRPTSLVFVDLMPQPAQTREGGS